jgi:hypothetical protein
MSEDIKKEVKPKLEREFKIEDLKVAPKKAAPKKRKAAAKRPPVTKPVKRYTFEQWAARRGVKNHHRGGLRAFIKNSTKPRTLADWDLGFKGY